MDHRGADIAVAEQLLYGADVGPVLEQMGGEGMAEGVAGGTLGEARLPDGLFHRTLEYRFVEVMAAPLAGLRIAVGPGRREYPLPRPLAPSMWVLAGQRPRQLHPARAALEVPLVLPLDCFQMARQVGGDHGG